MNRQQIDSLVNELKELNRAYRDGAPLVPDAEYDNLVERLKAADPLNPWLTNIEPVQVSSNRKRKLPIPMKSLNKAKSLSEVKKWTASLGLDKTKMLVIMPKFDGVSLLCNQITGEAYSRGGAENEGQDCTAHTRYLDPTGKPNSYPCPYTYTFGEAVFSVRSWEENFKGQRSVDTGDKFKSPRNTIAGLINRQDTSDYLHMAQFFRYGIDEYALSQFKEFSDVLDDLNKTFHQRSLYTVCDVAQLDEDSLHTIYKEWAKEYFIDGLVIYVDDLRLWERIGRQQTTGNPLYAIAYKHPDFTDAFETTVNGITWNVSKAGALKPVVNIEAVDTGDCIMENPTGYNAGWCYKNHIGPGASILVTRSGGVIPKILTTIKPAQFVAPTVCPVCGAPTEYDENGIELYCQNSECDGKKLAKLNHFLEVVGAENLGPETIAKLFNAGHTTVRKLMDMRLSDVFDIDGLGDSTVKALVDLTAKLNSGIDLALLMHASDCFKGIGKVKAEKILDAMTEDELNNFCDGIYLPPNEPDVEHPNFKALPITIQNLWTGYHPFFKFLEETGIPYNRPQKHTTTSDRYLGFSVCFSGIRDPKLEDKIRAGGGTIVSGVSKKTTHLIVQDPNATSSKITKAQNLNVPILTVNCFKSQY